MPFFKHPVFARIREHFSFGRKKASSEISGEVSAERLRNAKHGVPVGEYRKYIPGSTGDLRYHLDRSLKRALIGEFKLSEDNAIKVIEAIVENSQVRVYFYQYVNQTGKQRNLARDSFVGEVNRTLIKKQLFVTPRIRSAIAMVVDHHDH